MSFNLWLKIAVLVTYFESFYEKRRSAGLFVEKSDSVIATPEHSFEDAQRLVLKYPYDRFAQKDMFVYDRESQVIRFHSLIWSSLTDQEKARIIQICDKKLEEYYKKF